MVIGSGTLWAWWFSGAGRFAAGVPGRRGVRARGAPAGCYFANRAAWQPR
jgi:hypothetical protein